MTTTNDRRTPCCPEWEDLGCWVDTALAHYQMSGGKVPELAFRFCPWCGTERIKQPFTDGT